MALGLLDRLKDILPFAEKAAEEIVCEETDLLEKTIPKMFEVMHRVARVSCDYVKYGQSSPGGCPCPGADNRSENGARVGLLGRDRRNGPRVDEGHRGL
jgi:hypothetical protein